MKLQYNLIGNYNPEGPGIEFTDKDHKMVLWLDYDDIGCSELRTAKGTYPCMPNLMRMTILLSLVVNPKISSLSSCLRAILIMVC